MSLEKDPIHRRLPDFTIEGLQKWAAIDKAKFANAYNRLSANQIGNLHAGWLDNEKIYNRKLELVKEWQEQMTLNANAPIERQLYENAAATATNRKPWDRSLLDSLLQQELE